LSRLAIGQSVPNLINYQGRLTDQTGAALAPGPYSLQFRLWDSPSVSSANLIWGQQQNVTVQSNGVFNVILGTHGATAISGAAVNDLTFAFYGTNRFLGVEVISSNGLQVTAPTEIVPRQQLLSTPFAINAGNGNPPGTIMAFAGVLIPPGWLACDGRPVEITKYPDLWNAIGTAWGDGTAWFFPDSAAQPLPSGTGFNLPDLRGLFLRGVSGVTNRYFGSHNMDQDKSGRQAMNNGGNVGDAVGSLQSWAMQMHTHKDSGHIHGVSPAGGTVGTSAWGGNGGNQVTAPSNPAALGITTGFATLADPVDSGTGAGTPFLSYETRPVNAYVNYIIKY